jgi:hypothetical protein
MATSITHRTIPLGGGVNYTTCMAYRYGKIENPMMEVRRITRWMAAGNAPGRPRTHMTGVGVKTSNKATEYEFGMMDTMMEDGRTMPKAARVSLKRQIRRNMYVVGRKANKKVVEL